MEQLCRNCGLLEETRQSEEDVSHWCKALPKWEVIVDPENHSCILWEPKDIDEPADKENKS